MELILHNNPRSMFSEKVRRVLAFKGLDWTDIEVPGLPPKTYLTPLTGGYRRMPVLQIGADIYCDSALIIRKLEEIAPNPTIFPEASAGTAAMIADWADHRVAMWSIISVFPDFLPHVTEAFIKDRTALVADFAPDRVKVLAPHTLAQLGQFALMLDAALAQHPFVAGTEFSVADAACYHVAFFVRSSPRAFAPLQAKPRIAAWMDRIAAFPAPTITAKEQAYPLTVAAAAEPADLGDFSAEGDVIALGQVVSIAADDYAKERIVGEIVKLTPEAIGLRQHDDTLGDTVIHFPRLGFTIDVVMGA